MSDPKRWILDDAGSTDEERELLRTAADADIDPPAGAQEATWAALSAKLGPGDGDGGGGNGGEQPSASSNGQVLSQGSTSAVTSGGSAVGGIGIFKMVIFAVVSVFVIAAGYAKFGTTDSDPLHDSSNDAPTTTETSDAGAMLPPVETTVEITKISDRPALAIEDLPTVAPRESAMARAHFVAPGVDGEASPVSSMASPSASPTEQASRLREESRLLSEARDALRRGEAAGSLGKLEESRTRFASGVLAQEREALTIEALHRSGNGAAAASRAAAFLEAYPNSPHATRIQGFFTK